MNSLYNLNLHITGNCSQKAHSRGPFSVLYIQVWLHISNSEYEPRSWRRVLDTTLCDKVCQWLATDRWFSSGTPVSSTNKTDRHDITEILLKVALNTINQSINVAWSHLFDDRGECQIDDYPCTYFLFLKRLWPTNRFIHEEDHVIWLIRSLIGIKH